MPAGWAMMRSPEPGSPPTGDRNPSFVRSQFVRSQVDVYGLMKRMWGVEDREGGGDREMGRGGTRIHAGRGPT